MRRYFSVFNKENVAAHSHNADSKRVFRKTGNPVNNWNSAACKKAEPANHRFSFFRTVTPGVEPGHRESHGYSLFSKQLPFRLGLCDHIS